MASNLQASFGAIYAAMEIPRVARRTVLVLLVIHTMLLAYSAYVHSPTLNEPGHLVAGLSYWNFGRFDVYNVNPPLVRMVAAIPVLAVGYNEDWSGLYDGPGARPEMEMGEDFIAANGERSFLLFMIARWACIPFSWIAAVVCYLWARDLYGRPSGVFAATIWCFEPNVLAHASLITADAAGTALGLAACFTFWRWLKQPAWSQAAITGVVLGLAELAKATLVLFYPLWPLMWIIYRWPDRRNMCGVDWLREAGMLALRMVIGLYVLNVGYGFEGSLTQLKQFHFVSDLFIGSGDAASLNSKVRHSQFTHNRFANSWLGELPVPLPKNYVLGIDIQQKDFEHSGRPSYLRGEWRDRGWWYYYIYACAIKVPLGIWAIGIVVLVAKMARWTRRCGPGGGSMRDELILLLPAVAIFVVVSSKTGFSEHMRYVLPSFPYAFIWISQIIQTQFRSPTSLPSKGLTIASGGYYITRGTNWGTNLVPFFSPILISIFGCWMVCSSLWIYPHSLAYFSEAIGGPKNGEHYLLGSNLDWGQDLLYLRPLLGNSRINRIQLAYSGAFDPYSVGLGGFVDGLHPNAAVKTMVDNSSVDPEWYAISANFVCANRRSGHKTVNAASNSLPPLVLNQLSRVPSAEVVSAGYSISIYYAPHLSAHPFSESAESGK